MQAVSVVVLQLQCFLLSTFGKEGDGVRENLGNIQHCMLPTVTSYFILTLSDMEFFLECPVIICHKC
jgi:hypothetical protein